MPTERWARWRSDYILWVELFALANLAFLALDIFVAHSTNEFLRRPEYYPLYFSIAAPVLLAGALAARESWNRPRVWRITGFSSA